MNKLAKAAALSVAMLSVGAITAHADCQSRKTTGTLVGAAGGGLIGNVVTHGSALGTVAGVVGGGLVGHEVGRSGCTRRVV